MGDMGDYFRDTKEFRKQQSQKKKERNQIESYNMLVKNGFEVKEKKRRRSPCCQT